MSISRSRVPESTKQGTAKKRSLRWQYNPRQPISWHPRAQCLLVDMAHSPGALQNATPVQTRDTLLP
eukprot:1139858-Pelagomonas_calceolata.AAC.13